MSQLTITVCSSMEQWRALRSEWNDLLRDSAASSFFLTWEWLYSWARYSVKNNRQLFILKVAYKDQPVAIAPFYLEKKRRFLVTITELKFLGAPDAGSDYLDVFIKKGHEKRVAQGLYRYLLREARHQWDFLCLTDVPADSLFLLHFMNAVEADGKHLELSRSAYCPALQLPDSEEDLYAMMSSGWRKKHKQDVRVVNRDYRVEYKVYQGAEVIDHLDPFFEHYQEKAGWAIQNIRSILASFSGEFDQHPPLQLDFMLVDGKLRAALLHLICEDTLLMYLMAVDKTFNPKISLGNVLVGQSIVAAIENGQYQYYDFLKGHEQYKFHWSNTGVTTLCLRLWQKNLSGIVVGTELMLRNLFKSIMR